MRASTREVDELVLIPAEGYAEARATPSHQPGVLSAHTVFNHTSGVALNGLPATVGGTWSTLGTTSDFTTYTFNANQYVYRSTTTDASPRYAILTPNSYTDVEVGASMQFTNYTNQSQVLIARWADSANHLRIIMQGGLYIFVTKVVAGVVTDIAYSPITADNHLATYGWYRLRTVIYASGRGRAWIEDSGGATLLTASFNDTVLATGGTLSAGGTGMADYNNGTPNQRSYDDFTTSIPAAEPIVCYAGQSIDFRHDGSERQNSTGAFWGPPPSYRGSRFLIPPAGTRGRKTRIAVVARRNDTRVAADDNISDSTTIQVTYTPRYLVVPRD